jgi:hypothetical protein
MTIARDIMTSPPRRIGENDTLGDAARLPGEAEAISQ